MGRKRAERGGPGSPRKELNLAIKSTGAWKSLQVGYYKKKPCLEGKVVGEQMT